MPVCDCGVTLRDLRKLKGNEKNFQFRGRELQKREEETDSSALCLKQIAFKYQGHGISRAASTAKLLLIVMNDWNFVISHKNNFFFRADEKASPAK